MNEDLAILSALADAVDAGTRLIDAETSGARPRRIALLKKRLHTAELILAALKQHRPDSPLWQTMPAPLPISVARSDLN